MVTNVSPWSVKGVEPEAREAAKIAARLAGLTIGNWLNQIIRTAAAEQLTNSSGMINSNRHNQETPAGTATKIGLIVGSSAHQARWQRAHQLRLLCGRVGQDCVGTPVAC